MPHKFYHGRTGKFWNVTKRAVGVEVNKQERLFLFRSLDKFYRRHKLKKQEPLAGNLHIGKSSRSSGASMCVAGVHDNSRSCLQGTVVWIDQFQIMQWLGPYELSCLLW
ncbi:unnamed protein product [Musa acuminata subsp. burmannicoides]